MEVRERTHIKKVGAAVKYMTDGETWVEIPGDSIVSMNMWGFTPGIFQELGTRFRHFLQARRMDLLAAEYFLPDVVNSLVEEKKAVVRVLSTPDRWYGVTYREDRPRVAQAIRDLIRRGIYPDNLWE